VPFALAFPFTAVQRFADRKLVSPFSGCEENLSTFISNALYTPTKMRIFCQTSLSHAVSKKSVTDRRFSSIQLPAATKYIHH
jgi:hypothetical protein